MFMLGMLWDVAYPKFVQDDLGPELGKICN